jgi:hypothetical protein
VQAPASEPTKDVDSHPDLGAPLPLNGSNVHNKQAISREEEELRVKAETVALFAAVSAEFQANISNPTFCAKIRPRLQQYAANQKSDVARSDVPAASSECPAKLAPLDTGFGNSLKRKKAAIEGTGKRKAKPRSENVPSGQPLKGLKSRALGRQSFRQQLSQGASKGG